MDSRAEYPASDSEHVHQTLLARLGEDEHLVAVHLHKPSEYVPSRPTPDGSTAGRPAVGPARSSRGTGTAAEDHDDGMHEAHQHRRHTAQAEGASVSNSYRPTGTRIDVLYQSSRIRNCMRGARRPAARSGPGRASRPPAPGAHRARPAARASPAASAASDACVSRCLAGMPGRARRAGGGVRDAADEHAVGERRAGVGEAGPRVLSPGSCSTQPRRLLHSANAAVERSNGSAAPLQGGAEGRRAVRRDLAEADGVRGPRPAIVASPAKACESSARSGRTRRPRPTQRRTSSES